MNLSRRKALGLLGAIPVVGPAMAAKLQNEANAKNLVGMSKSPLSYGEGPMPTQGAAQGPTQSGLLQAAKKLPWFREELKELMRENNRYVGSLDPDLAVLKSMSLSAKIYHQRQRNIDRAIERYGEEEPWQKMSRLWDRIPKIFG